MEVTYGLIAQQPISTRNRGLFGRFPLMRRTFRSRYSSCCSLKP